MRPRPTTSDAVRALLRNRTATIPTNAAPTVVVEGTTATIRVYEPIDSWGGWWGLSAEELADAVDTLPSNITNIRLLINSPGGEVWDGIAMMNILSAHPAKVTAVVQGIAASAASFLAVGVDELVMNPASMLMVHDASAGLYGWAEDFREMAELLDKISDNIAAVYARKSGGTTEEWRAKMLAETWYTADEAVAAGLADRVAEATTEDAPSDADPEPDPASPFEDRILTIAEIRQALEAVTPPDDTTTDDPPAQGESTEIADDTPPAAAVDEDTSGRDRDELALLAL